MMNNTQAGLEAGKETPDLLSAEDMRRIIEEKQRVRAQQELERQRAAALKQKQEQDMFRATHLTPAGHVELMTRIRSAAENGETKLLVGQFPSAWCTDGGRRINVGEADWPASLTGIAKEFYEFWQAELKPKGFRLRVEIVSFPGGMPGDVGAFLSWAH